MSKLQTLFVAFFLLFAGYYSIALADSNEFDTSLDINAFPEAKRLRAILRQPESKMDLGKIKLTIDKMIDPSIDVASGLKQIDGIVAKIQAMLNNNPFPSSNDKLQALKRYLYEKGQWNDYKPYHYDFADPKGTKVHNKLLLNYIASRKGNCVSMPLLFVILGQRLGIEVTASTAPEHVFVKYTDTLTRITYNLEATNGANPTRDVWYRQQMPMTDKAIANGLYLRKLTKRETVLVMTETLAQYYSENQEAEKAIVISDILLEYYPKFYSAMLRKGHSYYQLLTKHFFKKYPTPAQIPVNERAYFKYLSDNNHFWYEKAESLGWREPTPEDEKKYMNIIKREVKSVTH